MTEESESAGVAADSTSAETMAMAPTPSEPQTGPGPRRSGPMLRGAARPRSGCSASLPATDAHVDAQQQQVGACREDEGRDDPCPTW